MRPKFNHVDPPLVMVSVDFGRLAFVQCLPPHLNIESESAPLVSARACVINKMAAGLFTVNFEALSTLTTLYPVTLHKEAFVCSLQ